MAPTRVAPRMRGDRAAVEAAARLLGAGEAPGDHRGRRGGAEPRASPSWSSSPSCSARRSMPRSIANTARSRPRIRCSAARWSRSRPRSARSSTSTTCCSRSARDLFTLSLPSDVEPMPPGLTIIHLDIDPWELGKNYPAEVAILGDPKAHAARTDRRRARAHVERRARRRARAPARRASDAIARRAREAAAPRRAALAGADADPAAGAARRRSARSLPEDAVVVDETISSARGMRQLSAATTRRASSACAAAASAGACRPRSASSSRCPTGRWSR